MNETIKCCTYMLYVSYHSVSLCSLGIAKTVISWFMKSCFAVKYIIYHSGVHEFTPRFQWGYKYYFCSFCVQCFVGLCQSFFLFVFLVFVYRRFKTVGLLPFGIFKISACKRITETKDFNLTCRYIDDILSIDNLNFANWILLIYPKELEKIEFDTNGNLSTRMQNK